MDHTMAGCLPPGPVLPGHQCTEGAQKCPIGLCLSRRHMTLPPQPILCLRSLPALVEGRQRKGHHPLLHVVQHFRDLLHHLNVATTLHAQGWAGC